MKVYRNLSGTSGIAAYEIGADHINVRFRDNDKTYKYSYRAPGKRHVEKMKLLAENGNGLSTYISQHIRENYESATDG